MTARSVWIKSEVIHNFSPSHNFNSVLKNSHYEQSISVLGNIGTDRTRYSVRAAVVKQYVFVGNSGGQRTARPTR